MLSRKDIVDKLEALMPELRGKYGVEKIGLFGSFSRNEGRDDDSDVDLLVAFNRPVGMDFFTLAIYLQEVLGRKVDLVTQEALRPVRKDSILKEVHYIQRFEKA